MCARGRHRASRKHREGSKDPADRTKLNRYANGHRRRQVRAWLESQGLPCHICGQPIDYSLKWWVDPKDGKRKRHPMSFEVDELVPVSLGGSPYDKANLAPAHRICNQKRGNKVVLYKTEPPKDESLKTSREW